MFCRLSSTTNTYRHAFALVSGVLVISKLHSFTLSAFALLFALIFINFSAYVNNLQIALALPFTLLAFEWMFSDGKYTFSNWTVKLGQIGHAQISRNNHK